MEGISRIDSTKAVGWYVRIYYEDKENPHAKFFSDGKYGGTDLALEEAVQYRKNYIKENPVPEKLPYRSKPISTNTTGINGVSETFQRSSSGEKIPCFCVTWAPEPNKPKCKKFYHHHYHSREEALVEAAQFRKEREREILKRYRRKMAAAKKENRAKGS